MLIEARHVAANAATFERLIAAEPALADFVGARRAGVVTAPRACFEAAVTAHQERHGV